MVGSPNNRERSRSPRRDDGARAAGIAQATFFFTQVLTISIINFIASGEPAVFVLPDHLKVANIWQHMKRGTGPRSNRQKDLLEWYHSELDQERIDYMRDTGALSKKSHSFLVENLVERKYEEFGAPTEKMFVGYYQDCCV